MLSVSGPFEWHLFASLLKHQLITLEAFLNIWNITSVYTWNIGAANPLWLEHCTTTAVSVWYWVSFLGQRYRGQSAVPSDIRGTGAFWRAAHVADGLQIRGSPPSLFSLWPLSPSLHCITDGEKVSVWQTRLENLPFVFKKPRARNLMPATVLHSSSGSADNEGTRHSNSPPLSITPIH